MAALYITEFNNVGQIGGLPQVAAAQPPVAEQTVAIGGGSLQSAAFNAATNLVRIHTDSVCSIEFGSNPTATATKARMAANTTEYFTTQPGQKVAVITNV